ncbi:pyrroline-5-carboxylate reductase [Bacillus taeanensis]|uniref:Pyrroline-5-carboxylate reductase n=1 Tax=Bacillus taeanensis TaxID=273032 RepID=A0A366XW65_9BACI|nr:pyrroline-5-carboxylate reductase [Bacillus taeanensis]RBW70392.1 pyrroline-5-carboxylate reductase [Bacillus taeanensis]
MFKNEKVVFVGAGSMAEAIIAGVIQQKLLSPQQIWVTNRSNEQHLLHLKNKYGIHTTLDKEEALKKAAVIVLAMKPKDVVEGTAAIRPYITNEQLFISVLAGISTSFLSELLLEKAPIIRVMPNTSAAVGYSATAMAKGNHTKNSHLTLAKQLFEAIGSVSIVEEEDLHAVTGLSGSGPAYVYYLAEAMEIAAEQIGLKEETAKELIIQTLLGAANMLKHSDESSSVLRQKVTSPGGTTEAGINILEMYKFQEAMVQCIKGASARSEELGKHFHQLIETK